MKTGEKVSVNHEQFPFTGKIEGKIKFSRTEVLYIVRADDDNKLYHCPKKNLEKITRLKKISEFFNGVPNPFKKIRLYQFM